MRAKLQRSGLGSLPTNRYCTLHMPRRRLLAAAAACAMSLFVGAAWHSWWSYSWWSWWSGASSWWSVHVVWCCSCMLAFALIAQPVCRSWAAQRRIAKSYREARCALFVRCGVCGVRWVCAGGRDAGLEIGTATRRAPLLSRVRVRGCGQLAFSFRLC